MHTNTTARPLRHRLALTLGATLWALVTLPCAAQSAGEWRLGGAVGSSDYGTALKAQAGQGLRLSFVPGVWRWEAQVTSFGSETYQQFGNTFQRKAWAVGASLLPQLPITPTLGAYAKLGVHHLHSEASGPGLSDSRSQLKLGYGAGLRWQVLPKLGLRLEAENIGGSGGDMLTLGAEVPL